MTEVSQPSAHLIQLVSVCGFCRSPNSSDLGSEDHIYVERGRCRELLLRTSQSAFFRVREIEVCLHFVGTH